MSTNKTVLAIDDEPGVTSLVMALCEQLNHRCIIAHNGEDGYNKAIVHKPDLILLDVNMPVKGGIETLKMLKENPAVNNTPVIVLTAREEEAKQALELGANKHIPKPFHISDLLQTLTQILSCFIGCNLIFD